MRPTGRLISTALLALLVSLVACGGKDNGNGINKFQCEDGKDNDGDGAIDFPDDPGCTSAEDDSEDSLPSPQCSDGRDNDNDGKVDYPQDPGCFAPQQDDESDDCPDGPGCPQCSNGQDDDMNGLTDYPNDPGCASASDTDEYTENPAACGSNVHIQLLPFDGHASGMLMAGSPSNLTSPMCGGAGVEDVYELRINTPKVVVATTDSPLTDADTVLYIRSADCVNNASELVCNDDIDTTNSASTITESISTPGTYYLVVDAHDGGTGGAYDLQVKYYVGEGEACMGADDCGPSLVCRIPLGDTMKKCSKHVCDDGVDDDMDGKNDFPDDPGCTSPDDDDETDDCPNGPNCPECADGVDNDGDMAIDYGADTTCQSASDASEACQSQEGVQAITTAMTMGDTTMALDDTHPSCGSSTNTAPDKTYRLDLPQMASLTIENVNSFDQADALYDSTCTGTAIACVDEPETMNLTNLAAGTYYYVVDGWSTGSGAYTINVSGTIANGASCEGALATSGAITCGLGYACKGNAGMKTCQPAHCSDGNDDDMDGKIDYPNDPGCDSPADDDETDPAMAPVCANNVDDDMDGTMDYPADFGCAAASGSTEVFCTGEMDMAAPITTKTTTGTTAGKSNDFTASCPGSSNAPDVAFGLQLPVPVASLQVDTIGSSFDTALVMRDAQCAAEITCNDDGGGSLTSKITMTNVNPGNYAILVDGYGTSNGAFTLNVQGTVAVNTACSSPLFSGGANAVLLCPMGTTCTGTPAKCQ